MLGRGIIAAAVVVYIGVMVGCMLGTAADSTEMTGPADERPLAVLAERQTPLPLRGAAMQLQRVDFIKTYYKDSVDDIAAIGMDTVLFVVDAKMENGGSSRIYLDMRMTPSPESLGWLINYAKGKGLRVVLMPIVLLDNPRGMEWRGTINPGENWKGWWASYRSMLHHYAWIAEAHKVDVLVIGSELVSTEKMAAEWRTTIEQVRTTYKGMITYSANWDHYKDIPFWDQLDLIGMNSYWKLGDNSAVPLGEIRQRWTRIQGTVLGFARQQGKPLVFLEVGWCSLRNAAHEPWDYTKDHEPIDLDLQARLYRGFFEVWHGAPGFGGFMIWEWTPGDGGPKDRGYTPEGKPAEKVLREWLKQPRWEVR